MELRCQPVEDAPGETQLRNVFPGGDAPLAATSLPLVAVVLVNWNALADTLECVASLQAADYANLHLIVVDNGSRNDEAATIRDRFPGVQVRATGRNLGFTGGNNVGIRLALEEGADFVLCLNNDTTVEPGFLLALVEAMQANPRAGVATAAIYQAHRPTKLAGLGCEFHFDRFVCGWSLHEPVAARTPAFETPYVEGCAMLLRRAVAEQTGGFDDRFFAYYEDADLCLRARARGWTCLAVPAAHIWHKVDGKPTGECSPTACFYAARNSWQVVRRHATGRERLLFYRRYPRHVLRLLNALVQTRLTRATTLDYDRTLSSLLGAAAGWLGCRGPRDAGPWVVLEKMVRPGLTFFAFLGSPFAPLLLRRSRPA